MTPPKPPADAPASAPALTIDALGRKCPIPIIMLAERIREVPIGQVVAVLADDPAAMIRHSHECRERGYRFAADPSQQLARMPGEDVLSLIDGADFLLPNEYEKSLLEQKSGLSDAAVLERVRIRVTTLGKNGVEITGREMERIHVPVAREISAYDPTGVGDGFRAGFFAALSWGMSLERAAQVGALLATMVLETVGTQEYELKPTQLAERLTAAYGPQAAADIAQHYG